MKIFRWQFGTTGNPPTVKSTIIISYIGFIFKAFQQTGYSIPGEVSIIRVSVEMIYALFFPCCMKKFFSCWFRQ